MSSIILQHVSFSYRNPYAEVFSDLSVLVEQNWRTGVVGRNGAGKSTLIGLIAGELTPWSGRVEVARRARRYPVMADETLSSRDVIKDAVAPFRKWEDEMAGLAGRADEKSLLEYGELQEAYQRAGGYEVDARIEREFAAMGLAMSLLDRPFSTLSGGEKTKMLITALFIDDDSYPLVDEPTNHLDMAGREQLMEYLSHKPGFMLVSHDRRFLDGAVDHVLSINRNDVRINRGNYSQWKANTDNELRHEARTRANIEKDIRHLRKSAEQRRRGADARENSKYGNSHVDRGFISHRAAKQMKKAVAIERRIDNQLHEKRSLLKNKEKERPLRIDTAPRGGHLLTVQNIRIRRGARIILDNFSLRAEAGDRIAITGPNGCGKSTLFDAIEGKFPLEAGVLRKPGHVRLARGYQQPLWAQGDLRSKLESAAMNETRFRQLMAVFGVAGDIFDRPLDTFSQGQLKKVDLCRAMMMEADLLLWDEPLNFVDVHSREQIEDAINEYKPTLLFIEHDRRFIDNVATGVITL